MNEPAGLQRMVVVSVVVHTMFAAGLFLAPSRWLTRSQEAPRSVMTISLSGGGGPRAGGLTAMGDRPVQVQTPPDEPKPLEAVRPPAAKTPEMTIPLPKAKPLRSTPAPVVKQAPDDAKGRTPTRGAETRAGSTAAETGTRGRGFGLSSGGGPGLGATLDAGDFCCPDYIVLMSDRIRSQWAQNQGSVGQVIVRCTIQRDGTLTDITVEKPTADPTLNLAAQRAIHLTRKLPPLPDAYPNPTLTVHLTFDYQR